MKIQAFKISFKIKCRYVCVHKLLKFFYSIFCSNYYLLFDELIDIVLSFYVELNKFNQID